MILPFVAVLAASPCSGTASSGGPSWRSLIGVYLATAFGITIGYHRLLTHRAFETYRPIKYLFAVLGSMAVQGP